MRLLLLLVLLAPSVGWALHLETTVRLDPSISKNIYVETVVSEWPGGDLDLLFPGRFGPALEVWKHIEALTVTQNDELLSFTIVPPAREDSDAVFAVKNTKPTPITVRYAVTPPDYITTKNITSVWSVLQNDHAVIKGASTFFRLRAFNNHSNTARIHFQLPPDWKVFCPSLQPSPISCGIAFKDPRPLVSTAFSVGKAWERQMVKIGPLDLEILRAGSWAFPLADFVRTLAVPLDWQVTIMGGHQRRRYQLINDTYPVDIPVVGRSSGGERLYESTFSMIGRDMPAEEYRGHALNLPVHEFFHTFFEKFSDNLTWFQEGFTEYMAYQSRYLSGAIDDAIRAKDILEVLESNYWNNTASFHLSIEEASRLRWESLNQPWTQVQLNAMFYRQVFLLGLVVDWLAAKENVEKNMSDVVASLWQHYGRTGVTVTEELIFATVEQELGSSVKEQFIRYLRTTDRLPVEMMLRESGWVLEDAIEPYLGFSVAVKNDQVQVAQLSYAWNRNEISALQIHSGDILQSIEGSLIHTTSEYKQVVRSLRIGDEAHVKIVRDGREIVYSIPVKSWRRVTKLVRGTKNQRYVSGAW